MEFGWINLFGAVIVVLILIPNIIYAVRYKQDETRTEIPTYLTVCEQMGRYACIVLMWLPLLVLYWRKKTLSKAMALAVIPTAIFLLSGILLRHPLLAAAAILFGASHCMITYYTHKGK